MMHGQKNIKLFCWKLKENSTILTSNNVFQRNPFTAPI